MNLFDLPRTEEDAFRFLQQHGILHTHRTCANGHEMELKWDRKSWRCGVKACRAEPGLRAGTWLEGSRVPFVSVVRFFYSWAHEYTTIKFCDHELGISKNTTVDWNNFLREVCAQELLANPVKIGGPGLTVEIDESVFSRRKNNMGRLLPEQWVFGGICRETKEVFLYAVENRTEATLMQCIKETINEGTHIMSDSWKPYLTGIPKLKKADGSLAYIHSTVNHSRNFVDPESGAHTNSIESSWNRAKAGNRRRWGTHRTLLDSYLCEFMWRQRRRNSDLFLAILEDISVHNPLQ